MTIRFTPYVDDAGESRWRASDADNGRILFAVTEGYSHADGARRELDDALRQIREGDYEIVEVGHD